MCRFASFSRYVFFFFFFFLPTYESHRRKMNPLAASSSDPSPSSNLADDRRVPAEPSAPFNESSLPAVEATGGSDASDAVASQ